jgi:hypothetical protein
MMRRQTRRHSAAEVAEERTASPWIGSDRVESFSRLLAGVGGHGNVLGTKVYLRVASFLNVAECCAGACALRP